MSENVYLSAYRNVCDSPLFDGIEAGDFVSMMRCWDARVHAYKSSEIITRTEDEKTRFMLVASGQVQMLQEDFLGRRTIIKMKYPGQIATLGAEASADKPIGYMLVAYGPTQILSAAYEKVVAPCNCACSFHTKMLSNLVQALMRGHYCMFQHIVHLSKRTTREKLLAYLSSCAQQARAVAFDVPFTRQELADYLCVDRSAMCTELTHLQDAGVIHMNGRRFELLEYSGMFNSGIAIGCSEQTRERRIALG